MKLLSHTHGRLIRIKGINAKHVEVKISTNFPSPSIRVVKDKLAVHQNNTGRTTYTISITLLKYRESKKFTTNPLYWLLITFVNTIKNRIIRERITFSLLF